MKMLKNIQLCAICSLLSVYVAIAEVSDDAAGRVEQSLDTVTPTPNNTSKFTKAVQDKHGKLMVNPEDVPSVRQGEIMLKEMCDTNGGEGTYLSAQMAVKNIKQCFDDIIMFSKLPSQIEEARPKGNLDQVFHSYCLRTDDFKGCVHKFLVEVDPCLALDQKSSKYTLQNITDAILKFACENEGDYIALFISEKGPQCISSKQPGIEKCIREGINESKTYETYVKMKQNREDHSDLNVVGKEFEKPFSFIFELEQCRTAYRIRTCIIEELKTCSGSTPANVVESIFNLIQKSTTCNKYSRSEIDPTYSAAASSMFTSIFSIVIPAVTILVARTFSS